MTAPVFVDTNVFLNTIDASALTSKRRGLAATVLCKRQTSFGFSFTWAVEFSVQLSENVTGPFGRSCDDAVSRCRCHVEFDKRLFRGARCKECNSPLLVSETYIRVLMLLSFLAAEALLWITNTRKLFYPTLGVPFGFLASLWIGFPLAFVILTVLVRTVPRLIAPTLVPRHWGSVNTLGLAAEDNHDTTTVGAKR